MPVTADLIIQITEMEGSFHKWRGKYVDAHPTFSKDNDARITIFSRCLNLFDNALFYLLFRTFQLPNQSWWSSLPIGYQKMGIPPNISIQIPSSEEDLKANIDNVNNFWDATNFIFLFSVLETSARQIVRVTHPGKFNHGRGPLIQIYQALLSTNYSNYDLMLELFQLARNTHHNNGVYFPEKVGKDRHLTFKGVQYDFVDGQKVQFYDAAKLLFFDIVPDLLHMINHIVNSNDVSKHTHIIDPSM
ncbi:MAG: hypothetical protein ACP5OH_03485 [Nitrososphaerota archaeon]